MFMNMCSTFLSVCGIIGSFLYDFYFLLEVQHVAGFFLVNMLCCYLFLPPNFFAPPPPFFLNKKAVSSVKEIIFLTAGVFSPPPSVKRLCINGISMFQIYQFIKIYQCFTYIEILLKKEFGSMGRFVVSNSAEVTQCNKILEPLLTYRP